MHIIGHSERVNRKPAESHPSTPVFMQDEFVCTPADLGLNDCSSFWNLDQNYEDFSPQAGKPIYHLMTNIGSALCSQKSTRFGWSLFMVLDTFALVRDVEVKKT